MMRKAGVVVAGAMTAAMTRDACSKERVDQQRYPGTFAP